MKYKITFDDKEELYTDSQEAFHRWMEVDGSTLEPVCSECGHSIEEHHQLIGCVYFVLEENGDGFGCDCPLTYSEVLESNG